MSVSSLKKGALVAVFFGMLGCGSKPPPPPEPPPTPEKHEDPPPPPPPKCEALDEKCTGKEGTRARVMESGVSFAPPPDWTYAQEADATVAIHEDVLLSITVHARGEKKKENAARDAAIDALLKKHEITLAAKKLALKAKPDMVKDVGDLKISLWQLNGAAHASKHGPVLVFDAPLPDGKDIVGVGFVPDDDKSGADGVIIKAIETITHAAPAEKPAAAADAPPAASSTPSKK